jgi:hypothetical protein
MLQPALSLEPSALFPLPFQSINFKPDHYIFLGRLVFGQYKRLTSIFIDHDFYVKDMKTAIAIFNWSNWSNFSAIIFIKKRRCI